jgi:hypothetical protein
LEAGDQILVAAANAENVEKLRAVANAPGVLQAMTGG